MEPIGEASDNIGAYINSDELRLFERDTRGEIG